MSANPIYERLVHYRDLIREITDFEPEIAITLGSGLGNFADNIEVVKTVNYSDLPGFPCSTAPGHVGQFIFGMLGGKKVACMKGRLHYYEGYPMSDVVMPLRLLKMLGAKTAIITNAVGAINKNYKVGSFMVSRDCISFFVPSPLIGQNIDELGPRFVDMSDLYTKELREKVKAIASREGIDVNEGVFVQLTGPQFETASEIVALRTLGADCAGMSSGVEAIAGAHMGMKVCGISCITNMCTGVTDEKLSGEEVIEVANRVSRDFEKLIKLLVEEI
ncbi:MAG: purine-nucleoside phosphorylase [Clostridia bacterium]|nr:purine-nucleoside phosphorylase [Clostridia bacterium]